MTANQRTSAWEKRHILLKEGAAIMWLISGGCWTVNALIGLRVIGPIFLHATASDWNARAAFSAAIAGFLSFRIQWRESMRPYRDKNTMQGGAQ